MQLVVEFFTYGYQFSEIQMENIYKLFTLKRWVKLIEQTTINYFTGLLKLNTFGEQAILHLSCGVLSTLAASTCTNMSYITE